MGSDLKIVIRCPCEAVSINNFADHAAWTETSERCHTFPQKAARTNGSKDGMSESGAEKSLRHAQTLLKATLPYPR